MSGFGVWQVIIFLMTMGFLGLIAFGIFNAIRGRK